MTCDGHCWKRENRVGSYADGVAQRRISEQRLSSSRRQLSGHRTECYSWASHAYSACISKQLQHQSWTNDHLQGCRCSLGIKVTVCIVSTNASPPKQGQPPPTSRQSRQLSSPRGVLNHYYILFTYSVSTLHIQLLQPNDSGQRKYHKKRGGGAAGTLTARNSKRSRCSLCITLTPLPIRRSPPTRGASTQALQIRLPNTA